jgi:uncharacterized protein YodC (DUF2158 family)
MDSVFIKRSRIIMTFQPGDVVTLKSGGQAMTVAEATETGIECIWIGEEGELFRETLPAAVLHALDIENGEEDEEEEEADEEEGEETDENAQKVA